MKLYRIEKCKTCKYKSKSTCLGVWASSDSSDLMDCLDYVEG